MCVPLPGAARSTTAPSTSSVAPSGSGMPLVHDEAHGLWALGPESRAGPVHREAPEPDLPDRDGNPFRLSSLRGRKVLLVAWASW